MTEECIGLRRSVLVYGGGHWFTGSVLVYGGIYWFTEEYIGLRGSVLVYGGVHWLNRFSCFLRNEKCDFLSIGVFRNPKW